MTTYRIVKKGEKFQLVSNYKTFKLLLSKNWESVAYIKGKDLRIEVRE